jgi:hypothetical protein
MSRKLQYAVDGDRVLKFLYDAASCLHKTATCIMKIAWPTALIIIYNDTLKPRTSVGL